jgi:serine/threonine protein kinase
MQVLANDTDRQFDWNRFFSLAEGLIGGLNTFHNNKPQILHREIRPQNLLVRFRVLFGAALSSVLLVCCTDQQRLEAEVRRLWSRPLQRSSTSAN